MHFALYKSAPSVISSLIRWQTRSVYSHVAIIAGGWCYEAIGSGFVKTHSIAANHDSGLVDVLEYKHPIAATEEVRAIQTLEEMVGARYDYEMVLAGFPFRYKFEPKRAAKKVFCSEAAFIASASMGPNRVLLERIQPWEVSPEHINISPLLKWTTTIIL